MTIELQLLLIYAVLESIPDKKYSFRIDIVQIGNVYYKYFCVSFSISRYIDNYKRELIMNNH